MNGSLKDVISENKIRYNEPMNKHTTMKVGGCADIMVFPNTIKELKDVINYAKLNSVPIKVIGNGSNIIVSDKGIEGIVIKITTNFSKIEMNGEYVVCLAGDTMPRLAILAKQNSLSGFEFACGIPGTIGGGVKMNAGAYGSQISNVLVSCKYLDENLNIQEIENKDMDFKYRHSIFLDNPKYIIIGAKFKLHKFNIVEIENKMNENTRNRKEKQPYEYPSAGSIFKRPEGYFVGKLIQDANLRGICIGDAQVSTKHTGFIVNKGNATCTDIRELIELVRNTVYEKFNVKLETEVEFIGRF